MSISSAHVCRRLVLAVIVLAGPCVALGAGAAAGDSPLVDAVARMDQQAIEVLLGQRVDVTASQPDGTTALHWAAHHGDVELLKRLIDAGADVSAANRYDIVPIWLAAENGHAGVVEALLRAGGDPNTTRGASGETVLMIAARGGHTDVVQRLVAYDADVSASEDVREQTALMWAAAEGHLGTVELLAEAGADFDAQSSTGITPLMFAIRSGDIGTTRALLDRGADLTGTGPDGTTMLVLAMLNAHWELAEALLDRGADPNRGDALHGRPLQVLALMRRAENRGLSGVLPRRPTGNIDSIALAEALLARGAEINDRIDWSNPMHVPPHMSLSYSMGIGYTGATPFFVAAKNCDVEFMKFLLANGADPSIGTAQNVTPLLAAAGVGYASGESPGTNDEAFDAVKLLQQLGNDVAAIAQDDSVSAFGGSRWSGATPLHGATYRGATALVEWLIDEGVPLDHEMQSGQTALDVAQGANLGFIFQIQPEIAAVLREAMVARGLPIPSADDRAADSR
jgi:ankyrin repeat protein